MGFILVQSESNKAVNAHFALAAPTTNAPVTSGVIS